MTKIGALEAGGTKMVLAVYDPASARGDDTDAAIQYARELKRPILSIHPDTLRTSCLTEFEFM